MGQHAHVILILLFGAQWFVGWWLAIRLLPAISSSGKEPPSGRKVSVVIPARNEEANLPALLGSLSAQWMRPLEVIVVDDDSQDGTAAVAEHLGAKVIRPGPPPPGWRGKTWACHEGGRIARGDYLLFLDADTRLVPGHGLSRLLGTYPGGAWSLVPWHDTGGTESFSALFNLLMALGTIPGGLAGPCLFIPRIDYEACGGHAAVRERILENVSLGGVLRKRGVPVGSAAGHGIVNFRMYPGGFRELVPGWTKGAAAGAGSTPPGTLLFIILWIGSLWGAAGTVLLEPSFVFIYALYAVQFGWMLRRVGRFPLWAALFYPLPLAFHLVIFIRSLGPAGKQTMWKGRKVAADGN